MRASTKVHIRKRQSSVLSPGQITELALDILNFLTKWKSESISVIVLFVTARWPMQSQRVYLDVFTFWWAFRCKIDKIFSSSSIGQLLDDREKLKKCMLWNMLVLINSFPGKNSENKLEKKSQKKVRTKLEQKSAKKTGKN